MTDGNKTLTQQVLGLVDTLLREANDIKEDMRVTGLHEALALAQNEALRRIKQQEEVLALAVEMAHERIDRGNRGDPMTAPSERQLLKAAELYFDSVIRHKQMHWHLTELEQNAKSDGLQPIVRGPLKDSMESLISAMNAQRAVATEARRRVRQEGGEG